MADDPKRDPGGWWPGDRRTDGGDEEERPRRPTGLSSGGGGSRPTSRYSLFVGLAFVALIIVALLNLVGNEDAGILGVDDTGEGTALAQFAAPDALGSSTADANVFQDDCESSRNPCPADEVRVPACEIEPAEALRVCDFFDRPLAISFWFTKGGDCLPSQDAFDAVARRYDDRVNFLSINIRDSRETVESLIEERDWSVPVGLDPDGAVSNLYRVGLCPTIALAYEGGILQSGRTGGGDYTEAEIERFVRELLTASRERAETSR